MTDQPDERYYLKIGEADATAYMDDNGFVVFDSSLARKGITSSRLANVADTRADQIASGILKEFVEQQRFTRDHRFKSPSETGVIVTGS